MSPWPILLRVLLCVSLILNGATAAVASTHMQVGNAETQAASAAPVKPSQVVVADEMPCHQHLAKPATAHDAPSIAVHPAPGGSKPPSADCCKSGACPCACMHVAQAALPATTIALPLAEHGPGVRPLPLAHATPLLPHLIRPPIG